MLFRLTAVKLLCLLAVACGSSTSPTEAPNPTASVPATAVPTSTAEPTPGSGPAPSATPAPTLTTAPTLTPVPTPTATPAPILATPAPPSPTATMTPDTGTPTIEEREAKRIEAVMASRVSQLPQSEQDCLSEFAQAGIGWPYIGAYLSDTTVDRGIFLCLSDRSITLMMLTWVLEELLAFQLMPETNECFLSSPFGGLTRKAYTLGLVASDSALVEVEDDIFPHIMYYCLSEMELAMLGESIPADRLEAFKQATDEIGGLDALAESYTPAAKKILLELEHPEKPATPPTPPPAPTISMVAPPAPTPIP